MDTVRTSGVILDISKQDNATVLPHMYVHTEEVCGDVIAH